MFRFSGANGHGGQDLQQVVYIRIQGLWAKAEDTLEVEPCDIKTEVVGPNIALA